MTIAIAQAKHLQGHVYLWQQNVNPCQWVYRTNRNIFNDAMIIRDQTQVQWANMTRYTPDVSASDVVVSSAYSLTSVHGRCQRQCVSAAAASQSTLSELLQSCCRHHHTADHCQRPLTAPKYMVAQTFTLQMQLWLIIKRHKQWYLMTI